MNRLVFALVGAVFTLGFTAAAQEQLDRITVPLTDPARPVTLEVTLNALRRHPLTFRRTAGFSATGTLRRSDFGMDAWKSVVGDEVKLIIEVEAQRGGDDAPAQ